MEVTELNEPLVVTDGNVDKSSFSGNATLAGATIRDANLSGMAISDCDTSNMRINGHLVSDLIAAYRKNQ